MLALGDNWDLWDLGDFGGLANLTWVFNLRICYLPYVLRKVGELDLIEDLEFDWDNSMN